MRIAVLSVHTSPLARPGGAKAGGLNVYVIELARHLVSRGCSVDIFTRASAPQLPAIIEVQEGLRAVNVVAGPEAPLSAESMVAHLDDFTRAVETFALNEQGPVGGYDIIHSHYWLSGLVGERLKQVWGIPHVTMFHTLGEIKNRSSLQEHESALRIESERNILHDADRVICATEQERASIRQLYGADAARVEVIPLGVDLDRFQPVAKAEARQRLGLGDERIVLFVGRLEPLKGVDILIGAASMLDSDVECSVVIVGGDETADDQVTQLRALGNQLGIGDRIAFVGAVDHDLLPLYYSAADVCVVPSHYESFGLVAIEAMASGLPVVASRVGGLTGTVKDGETGYLIPWLCPEPFAERIELLLDNEPLRASLGEAARDAVGRYRWENVATAVMDVYASLTGASTSLQTATTDT